MRIPEGPELLATVPALSTVGAVMFVAVNVVDVVRIGVHVPNRFVEGRVLVFMLICPGVLVLIMVPTPFTSWRLLGIVPVSSSTVIGCAALALHWALHAVPHRYNATNAKTARLPQQRIHADTTAGYRSLRLPLLSGFAFCEQKEHCQSKRLLGLVNVLALVNMICSLCVCE